MPTGALVIGPQSLCKEFLRSVGGFYVYILRRPDGRPFYVGKGVGDRVFAHENEARHPNDWRSNAYKLNVIRSIWRSGKVVTYEIDYVGDDEEIVYAREAKLIGHFKRLHEGGPLTNLAPGGGATTGAAPVSKEKHSTTLGGIPDNNPERATLNGYILSIADMKSVVLKPTEQFVARPTQRYPNKSMAPSLRQAVALVASAAANGIALDGGCNIPRRVVVEGVSGLVENGVACDVVTSGLGALIPNANPADECFQLTADQARIVVGLVGIRKCVDLGVLDTQALLAPSA
ncbi:GIY-YIG nuclease family protein [Microvirga aerilata]|uniref:GIY-YIG nuclease family protein n=1 Tax=Microvirga aerilata TaxID=670292 RepID=A0A936ZA11_9HYPH|nr:GIY-YIG nuclease family protein [Microvirga aerilata]MBL0402897.1 GIY-YIG nuclease family protein [Microvirga aerilata]